jgi:hypothetical protein
MRGKRSDRSAGDEAAELAPRRLVRHAWSLPGTLTLPSWRPCWAVLLLALALFGAVDLHVPGAAHDPLEILGGVGPSGGATGSGRNVYSPEAAHPRQPAHFEAATAAERPLCPACLNRLRTGGARLAPAVQPAAPVTLRAVLAASARAPVRTAQRPQGARAPPLA